MTDTVVQFYQKLFTSCEPLDFEEILEQMPTKVIEDMNVDLLKEFTTDEVENALKQMAPLKSLELDDMPPLFYQSYWSLVGPDVAKSILLYVNSGNLPNALCHSFITLIPKVKILNMFPSIDLSALVMFFLEFFQRCWQIG